MMLNPWIHRAPASIARPPLQYVRAPLAHPRVGADPAADAALADAYKLTSKWQDGDFAALDQLCKEIGCHAEDLLLVMTSESTLDPTKVNRNAGGWPIAAGLNQLGRIAAEQLGYTPKGDMAAWQKFAEDYLKKPVAEQLPVVIAFYKSTPWGATGKDYHSAAKLYQANAAPSTMFMGDGLNTVLYPFGTDAFENNKGLWILRKPAGVIMGDLKAATDWHRDNPIYKAALLRLQNVRGQAGPW